jgi:hypothetical protein
VNDHILELYKNLQNDFDRDNVFFLLDTTNLEEIPQNINNLLQFDITIAEKIDPFIHSFNLPGLGYRFESKMLYSHYNISKEKQYDYIWFIEYDVWCNGSFAKALEYTKDIHCDLLTKGGDTLYEIRRQPKHHWCWWNDLFGELSDLPMSQRVGGFLPVMRVSTALLDLLHKNLGVSTGFCEIYIPTLCVANGLSYKTLHPNIFGIFQYRPILFLQDVVKYKQNHTLWHPVK